jgi:predicted ArsR family transcriptional regulator
MAMDTEALGDTKRRIIDRLKRVDTATTPELAAAFDLTDTAVRQHLDALVASGLVEIRPSDRGTGRRGRPATQWQLTGLADQLFPDRHGDLTVELIRSIRTTLGDDALDAVVAARTAAQRSTYQLALPDPARSSVRVRVRRLAEVRSAEGYVAEATTDGASMLLIEHHCPICDAAEACTTLCRSELALFQDVLGADVTVTREQHLLAGDRRCAYRITPTRTKREHG